MPLQNFVTKSLPVISAAWLNSVDVLKFTVFGDSTTKAAARTALELGPQLASHGIDTGVVNAAVVTLTGPITGFLRVTGAKVIFTGVAANTGPSTLNVNGTGVAAIVNQIGNALTGGELSVPAVLLWNGAAWQIIAGSIPIGNARTATEISNGVIPTDYQQLPGNVLRMGALLNGIADDTVAFQRAGLTSLSPFAPSGTTIITGTITLRANQIWRLDGTKIQITGTTVEVFVAPDAINDWLITGKGEIIGDNNAAGSIAGAAKGVSVTGSNRWRVEGLTCKNIKGWGFYIAPGTYVAPLGDTGRLVVSSAHACYRGFECVAGTGAEYGTSIGFNTTACAIGVVVGAGNWSFTGGNHEENTVNIYMLNGANGQHGMFTGVNINHAVTYNVQADGLTNGESFVGCHLYQGDIWLKNCVAIMFESCFVDPTNYYFEGSNGCGFRNCVMPRGYANTINNNFNGTPSYTIWDNCKERTGLLFPTITTAMYEGIRVKATSPGLVYTPAQLTAEQTVLLTDAENFTAEAIQTLYDGYVAATGIFTCQGLGTGRVRVNATLRVTYAAADDAFLTGMGFVYVYLRKNGALYRWFGRVRLTTTSMHFYLDCVVEMAKTDTLSIRIGQSGGAVANNVTIAGAETEVIVEGL